MPSSCPSLFISFSQRVYRQLANAQDKLERAEKHAEEKRYASQHAIERLLREYEQMDVERRDNDKQVEELRKEADDTEAKVSDVMLIVIMQLTPDS